MAEVSKIEVIVKSDAAQRSLQKLQSSISQVDNHVKKTQANLANFGKRINTSMTDIAKTAGAAAAGFAAFTVGKGLVNTIREFERLRTTLKTVTGSAENAEKAFKLIQDFTASTPFQLGEVTQSFNILKSQGIEPTKQALEGLGNIAAAQGKSIEQVAEAAVDAQRGEFERLKEFGIIASKQGEQVAITFQGITKVVQNSSQAITAELVRIGQTNFAGALVEQSKTLNGVISNIQDQFSFLAFQIGEGGLRQALTDVAKNFMEVTRVGSDTAAKLGQVLGNAVRVAGDAFIFLLKNIELVGAALAALAIGKVITSMAALAQGVGVVTAAVRGLFLAITAHPIGALVTAIAALVTIMGSWLVSTVKAKTGNADLFTILEAVASVIYDKVKPAIDLLVAGWEKITAVAKVAGDFIVAAGDKIASVFVDNENAVTDSLNTVKETVNGFVGEVVTKTKELQAAEEAQALAAKLAAEAEAAKAAAAAATVPAMNAAANASQNQANASAATLQARQKLKDTLDEQLAQLQIETQLHGQNSQMIAIETARREAAKLGISGEVEERLKNIQAIQQEIKEKNFAANFKDYMQSLRDEIKILSLNRKEREIATEVLRQEQIARANGAELTQQQRRELEALLRQRQQAADQARIRDEAEMERQRQREQNEKSINGVISQRAGIYSTVGNAAVSSMQRQQSAFENLIGSLLKGTSIGKSSSLSRLVSSVGGSLLSGIFGSVFGSSSGSSGTTYASGSTGLGSVFTSGINPSIPITSSTSTPANNNRTINTTVNVTATSSMTPEDIGRATALALNEELVRRGVV